eukprot:Rmarinus@m.25411
MQESTSSLKSHEKTYKFFQRRLAPNGGRRESVFDCTLSPCLDFQCTTVGGMQCSLLRETRYYGPKEHFLKFREISGDLADRFGEPDLKASRGAKIIITQ